MSAEIAARNLTVSYQAVDGRGLHALGPINFTIQPGEFVSFVGPSGSGKSTLIRVVAGLVNPTEGGVWLDETPVTAPSPRVALMFQEANLLPWRTVTDNIALPLELAGVAKKERTAAALALLPRLGLDCPTSYPAELSGGMAQRVALGRVLIQKPDVLLLDEPFGALDALTRERLSQDLIHMWEHDRQTVMMVTHDIHEAVMLSDRIIVLSRRPGQVIADIRVSIPRPRAQEDAYSTAFGDIALLVRSAIERA